MPLYAGPANKYVSAPPGALDAWRTALINSTTTPAIAMIEGASVAHGGAITTNILTKTYWALWRAGIVTRYGAAGDFLTPMFSASWNAAVTYSTVPWIFDLALPSVTVDAGWTQDGPWQAGKPTALNNGANPLFHYVHPSVALGYNGLSFDIFYFDRGSTDGGSSENTHTWTWNLNGGANQTVTLTGSHTVKKVSVTNATPGWTNSANQVINFMTQSTAAAMSVIGISSYPGTTGLGTTGVFFAWTGYSGYLLSAHGSTGAQYPADKVARLVGTTGTAIPFAPSGTLSPPFAPDLVIIDIPDDPVVYNQTAAASGAINAWTGLTPGEGLHVLRRKVQAYQAKSTGCSLVFHFPNIPDGVNADIATAGYVTTYQPQNIWPYNVMYRQIADYYSAAWVNTDRRWGERGLALGFLTSANPHPTDAGHLDIKNNGLLAVGL